MIEEWLKYHFLQERQLCDFYLIGNWGFILNIRLSGAKIM